MVAVQGVGIAALGVEQFEEPLRLVLVEDGVVQDIELAFRGGRTVDIGLQDLVGPIDLGHGVAHVMNDLPLHLADQGPRPANRRFGIANGGMALAETDRHRELGAELPFLVLAAGKAGKGVVGFGSASLQSGSSKVLP